MAKPITVSITGNAGPLKKAVGEAESSLDRLSGSFKKLRPLPPSESARSPPGSASR